jgi:hypothetical protein
VHRWDCDPILRCRAWLAVVVAACRQTPPF